MNFIENFDSINSSDMTESTPPMLPINSNQFIARTPENSNFSRKFVSKESKILPTTSKSVLKVQTVSVNTNADIIPKKGAKKVVVSSLSIPVIKQPPLRHTPILPKITQGSPNPSETLQLDNELARHKPKTRRKYIVPAQKSVISLIKSGNTFYSLEKLDREKEIKIANALTNLVLPTRTNGEKNSDVQTSSINKNVIANGINASLFSSIRTNEKPSSFSVSSAQRGKFSETPKRSLLLSNDQLPSHYAVKKSMRNNEKTSSSPVLPAQINMIPEPLKRKKILILKKDQTLNHNPVKYRTIFPEDLELAENNKIVIKELDHVETSNDSNDPEIENKLIDNNTIIDQLSLEGSPQDKKIICKNKKMNVKRKRRKKKGPLNDEKYLEQLTTVEKTRSGRIIKLPTRTEEVVKKKRTQYVNFFSCLICNQKFIGIKRLNYHFALHPTHKPNNVHTDLFMCFLDIMRSASLEDKGLTFVEQLQNLISKLRDMVPCMINNMDSDDGKLCDINEDLGRVLGIEPGKYNISFDEAVKCLENGTDNCKHVLLKTKNVVIDEENKKPDIVIAKKYDEMSTIQCEESNNCARTEPVDKWPLLKKRLKTFYPTKVITDKNITCPNIDIMSTTNEETIPKEVNNIQNTTVWLPKSTNVTNSENIFEVPTTIQIPVLSIDTNNISSDQSVFTLQGQLLNDNIIKQNTAGQNESLSHFNKFQSSHFNIKSSPIKSTNTSFKKIQIKDNVPFFMQLKDNLQHNNVESSQEKNLEKSSEMQIDINAILSELSNNNSNKYQAEQQTGDSEQNEFFKAMQQDQIRKEFSVQSNMCELPHRDITCSNFLVCNDTAVRSPSDRVLPSDHMNRNEHFVSSLAQNVTRSSHQQNDFLNSSNSRMGQNDCMLANRNAEISKNDRLLSSGNIQISQSDKLISANIETTQNDSLVNLCENESNLEASRMSLPLLDNLSSDCLSFADSELRGTSLDIPLDLFPFNHTE